MLNPFAQCLLALAALSLLTSCVVQGTAPQLETGPRGEYPSGPFGKTEGAIIEPLNFVQPDGQELGFEEIQADENNRIMLVSTSAGWCTACIEEQPALAALHERYNGRGLFVMVTLFEDSNFQPADARFADDWVTKYKLPFAVVADPGFQFKEYYDSRQTPMNMIVDLSSMKIVKIILGTDSSALENIIEVLL
jgi:thiol-disulfide isomerase/thioredoxin